MMSWTLTVGFIIILSLGITRARGPEPRVEIATLSLQLLSGETQDIASLRGRPVLLNVWATWCGPCKLEVPALARFAERHPEFAVIGIVAPGSLRDIRESVKELGATYPIALGDDATLRSLGVEVFPTTIFLNEQGEVRGTYAGLLLDPQLELTRLIH